MLKTLLFYTLIAGVLTLLTLLTWRRNGELAKQQQPARRRRHLDDTR